MDNKDKYSIYANPPRILTAKEAATHKVSWEKPTLEKSFVNEAELGIFRGFDGLLGS